jgi:hypothetical protein
LDEVYFELVLGENTKLIILIVGSVAGLLVLLAIVGFCWWCRYAV